MPLYPLYIRVLRVGRKRLADRILEELKEEPDDNHTYIIVYDFSWKKNPKEFYQCLRDLRELGCNITVVQKSVLKCLGKRAARAVFRLARRYGAEVYAYKVLEEPF